VKQLARRIGRTLAFMLPLVLVTTGTLAVTRVPWAPPSSHDEQVLATSSDSGSIGSTAGTPARGTAAETGLAPQDLLRTRLLTVLQRKDPGAALDELAAAMQQQPSLTRYCTGIARDLGRAAVRKYDGNVRRALGYARPVCDGSFAAGGLGG
jgi:hypothetical protein